MSYTDDLIAALSSHGVSVESVPTGGGCNMLAVLPDHVFGLTDGDCGVPDGIGGFAALITMYDEEDGSSEGMPFLEVFETEAPTAQDVARIAADWIQEHR